MGSSHTHQCSSAAPAPRDGLTNSCAKGDLLAMQRNHQASRRGLLSALCLAAMACSTLAASGQAQNRPVHDRSGLWVVTGFGSARNDLTCEGCVFTGPEDGWRGGSGSGAVYGIGVAVTPRWLVGVELNPSGKGAGTWTERGSILFMLLGVVQFYPRKAGGAHLNLGVGPISVGLGGEGGGAENYGLAARAGAGYDIRFRWMRSVAITPYVSYAATRLRDGVARTSGNGAGITGLDNRYIIQSGIALRWY